VYFLILFPEFFDRFFHIWKSDPVHDKGTGYDCNRLFCVDDFVRLLFVIEGRSYNYGTLSVQLSCLFNLATLLSILSIMSHILVSMSCHCVRVGVSMDRVYRTH
jgi:hypothetical protein